MVISLPAALRNAFVHRTLRGFRFILRNKREPGQDEYGAVGYLKFLWHLRWNYELETWIVQGRTNFEVQKRKTLASFRTKADPAGKH
jgi:hypothetical protein